MGLLKSKPKNTEPPPPSNRKTTSRNFEGPADIHYPRQQPSNPYFDRQPTQTPTFSDVSRTRPSTSQTIRLASTAGVPDVRNSFHSSSSSRLSSCQRCTHITKSVNLSNIKNTFHATHKVRVCGDCIGSSSDVENYLVNSDYRAIWMCLQCGHQGCSRLTPTKHANWHSKVCGWACHALAVNLLKWVVWCYGCSEFVDLQSNKEVAECVDYIKKAIIKSTLNGNVVNRNGSLSLKNTAPLPPSTIQPPSSKLYPDLGPKNLRLSPSVPRPPITELYPAPSVNQPYYSKCPTVNHQRKPAIIQYDREFLLSGIKNKPAAAMPMPSHFRQPKTVTNKSYTVDSALKPDSVYFVNALNDSCIFAGATTAIPETRTPYTVAVAQKLSDDTKNGRAADEHENFSKKVIDKPSKAATPISPPPPFPTTSSLFGLVPNSYPIQFGNNQIVTTDIFGIKPATTPLVLNGVSPTTSIPRPVYTETKWEADAESEERERRQYLDNGESDKPDLPYDRKKLDWFEMTLDPDYAEDEENVDPTNPYLFGHVGSQSSDSKGGASAGAAKSGRGKKAQSSARGKNRRGNGGNVAPTSSPNKKVALISPITYECLNQVNNSTARMATLLLRTPKNGLLLRLKQPAIQPDMLRQIMEVLAKICRNTSFPQIMVALLGDMLGTNLFKIFVPQYLIECMSKGQSEELAIMLDCLLLVFERILAPRSAIRNVHVVNENITVCLLVIAQCCDQLPGSMRPSFEDLQGKCDRAPGQRWGSCGGGGSLHSVSDVNAKPPDDFRSLPTTPMPHELAINFQPFLRKNLERGRFADVDHYLDIQFRLLREDFIAPLREGIDAFKNRNKTGKKAKKANAWLRGKIKINIYHQVSVTDVLCSPADGVVTQLRFDVERLADVNWENTRRFMCGSLLVLSDDNFVTFVLATVVWTDPKQMARGVVLAKAIQGEGYLWNVTCHRSFVMAESPAFFGAYAPVLEALQEFSEESLPFKSQVVDVRPEIGAPKYLCPGAMYNLGEIFNKEEDKTPLYCEVLEPRLWPTPEKLGLDCDQYEAYKLALTKEVALIQGPPGTGKTFIGLKIVQTLLVNNLVWNKEQTPILIVCFTNHALDQFLEGIVELLPTGGVVRVGGRSKSAVLEKFNLVELRRKQRRCQNMPNHVHTNRKAIFQNLQRIKKAVNITLAMVRESKIHLLNEYALCSFMSKSHHDQLCLIEEKRLGSGDISVIAEWLGLIVQQRQLDDELDNLEALELDSEDEEVADTNSRDNLTNNRALYRSTEYLRRSDDEEFQQRMADYDAREYEDLERRGVEERRLQEDLQVIKQKLLVQLSAKGTDGWTRQGGLQRMEKKIGHQLKKSDIMGVREARLISDIWGLSVVNRWRLYRFWLANMRQDRMEGVRQLLQEYSDAHLQMKEICLERDVNLLKGARIIGMTTTGAARNRELIKIIGPSVVVVEEAAEVLESHVVTSFTRDCRHVILIGDQQQLKPNPSSYALAQQCSLDVSLFERLINNKITYRMLTSQHRMRPSISKLLVPHIYKNLRDHKSVMSREEVRGMPSSVIFLNHGHLETTAKDTPSFANKFEAEFVLELYRYLVKQEYQPEQITILTTYGAQVKLIRDLAAERQMVGVACSSVDGFQGKENDIIILSLVRSNNQSNVGFLKVANRICVALSRARNGLYCVGNLKVLARVKDSVWTPIVASLMRDSQIVPQLELACPNHPSVITVIREPKDFEKVPEGGCLRICGALLACGEHKCTLRCHAYDRQHLLVECQRPCSKSSCVLNHPCRNKCGQECSLCLKVVDKIYRGCGHSNEIACHQEPEAVPCRQRCKKLYPLCGHQCGGQCGHKGPCGRHKCSERVEVESPCGHLVEMTCCHARDRPRVLQSCTATCSELLSCGHKCGGTCKGCKHGTKHKACVRCVGV